MSFYCVVCDRSFDSNRSLEQHNQDSPAHVFDCAACNRQYRSSRALQQHVRDSVAHTLPFEHALQQHLRDSPAPAPAHVQSFDCVTCDRHYGSETALQQHLRDSAAHALSFNCSDCDRPFNSEQALQQHLRDSPAHIQSFDCETCNRHYGSATALEHHLRDSPAHQQNTETPLDAFFRTFPAFDYDPSLPPATSYANLQKHQGWRRGNAASHDAWDRYQDALKDELRLWYGAENDLTAWHALCRAIGINPLPEACEQCERVGDCVTKVGRSMLTRIIGCTKNTR